jgi:hypothetical protein
MGNVTNTNALTSLRSAGNPMNYLLNGTSNSIKPSVSFISMGRKDYK